MAAAKKNFYAVKGTVAPAIYASWAECQRRVHGVKGALFKGFVTRAEAEAWLDDSGTATEAVEPGELLVYVDGSFAPGAGRHAGWGFVVVDGDQEVYAASGRTAEPALSRNIDGELEATLQAIDWCRGRGARAVICHDYEGVGRWALGEWKASSAVARRYQERLRGRLDGIRFCKVSAHTGHRWNDRADALAKQGLTGR
jgi:viroplasmin and RNaseH domain-containing protein